MIAVTLSGFVLATVVPRLASRSATVVRFVSTALPAAIFIYFCGFFRTVVNGESVTRTYEWVPSLGISLSFHLDGLSLLFVLLISGVGTLIFAYAGAYLKESGLGRFYAWMLVFLSAMLGLALSDDFILLFVFWELTSLVSYMLIGFDAERPAARAAALEALLITSGGGLAMLAGFLLLRTTEGVDRLSDLAAASVGTHPLFTPILLLLLVGAFTKSAQFPFHFWLPGAMEAPAPVSAYLHSATMVKAGVYLLARLSPVYSGSDVWTIALIGAGTVTMVLGAFVAAGQKDMKLAFAHSTVGALGMMVMLLGLGTPAAAEAALLFLIGHALYKGALFLVSGAVDLQAGTRDVIRLGGLRRLMPLTAAAATLAALSMAGVPPLFGYVGKELVFEAVLEGGPWRMLVSSGAVLTGTLFLLVALNAGLSPFWSKTGDTPRSPREGGWPLWGAPLALAGLGLVLGVVPSLAAPLVAAATEATTRAPVVPELGLWHGWTPALGLSGLGIAGGLLLFLARSAFLRASSPVVRWAELAPGRAYRAAMDGLNRLATAQTRLLQSGYLRRYLLTVITVTGALALYPMLRLPPIQFSWEPAARVHEVVVAALVVAGVGVAVRTSSALTAVAGLGVTGYGVALIYFLFGAPDLALTQFVVETLTVILFVLVLYHLPPFSSFSLRAARARDIAISLAVGVIIALVAAASMEGELDLSVPQFYSEASLALAHGRNIVNVILVDFRALDTLGEIVVLATAAAGVYALLRTRAGKA